MISVSSSFDLHQQQIAEVQANQGDIEERLNGLTSRLSDLRELIKERSKVLEDVFYQRCRIEEESELLKRRLDAMARVENPTEMKLAKEREEYKVRDMLQIRIKCYYLVEILIDYMFNRLFSSAHLATLDLNLMCCCDACTRSVKSV